LVRVTLLGDGLVTSAIKSDHEFRALLELSAALGANPLRTQAAGGNTSIKRDGAMWIKASGAWLAEATQRDMMTPVLLSPLLEAISGGDPRAENGAAFVDATQNANGLRPSIETSVHALLPHSIVIHIHCVDTIAIAVRADAEAAIASRLTHLRPDEWAFIPYVKPGLSLAKAISRRLTPRANVLVLGNHGLVVGADTVAEASHRTAQICRAFAADARIAGELDLVRLSEIVSKSDYRLPRYIEAHATATDPKRLSIARQGTLYPDHVVFLGSGIVESAPLRGWLETPTNLGRAAPMLVLPGLGVVLHRSSPRGVDEMARCLADVTGRISQNTQLRILTSAEESELVNWEAEKYRHALNTVAE
jgi:rhamnose utilization protein RhaD (predicted bifunctional aldolase and dehydrogenase)